MDTTTAHFIALGRLLRNNYGTSGDRQKDHRNYAILWDTLMDALEHDDIDRDLFDAEYKRVVAEHAGK